MKTKRVTHFGVLFALLICFSAVSLGFLSSDAEMVKAVSATGGSGNCVHIYEEAFDAKVLNFLKKEKVCAITDEQAEMIAGVYETETKAFDIDGSSVNVLYVEGNPLNKKIIQDLLGADFEGNCHVVHGNKIIALATPIFVS